MKNILVLGGCGFIGSFLVKRLQEEHNVLVYDRCEPVYEFKGKSIIGNFAEEQNFYEILVENQVDLVFHLISTALPTDSTHAIEQEILTNVIPSVRLFEAMVKANVKRLIFSSSGGTVYGESFGQPHKVTDRTAPICSYGIQKNSIENYIALYNRYYGMEFIVARISNPYGVWTQQNRMQGIIPIFIRKLLDDEPITVFGDTKRDYIFIDDVIEAFVCMIEYCGMERVFNVGTGVATSISEIIGIIETEIGKKFSQIEYKDIRKCDVKENVLDASKSKEKLKWSIKNGIEKGVIEVIEKIKKNEREE
ncbi:MAG: NAD-dependent epimerase/dehydratase family protein [Lachnospiraceae bacterium]|nr:NAD-dependent epimerase/dehydratase family protein [Lachnospiraceae bacterium]